MPYLTKDEYKEFGFAEIPDDKFDMILANASLILDGITGNFYVINDLEKEIYSLRSKLFKKAVAKQMEFMSLTKLFSSADVANKPSSVSQSIGGTSVSQSFSNGSSTSSNNLASMVADELFFILQPTGLLYRGVKYR